MKLTYLLLNIDTNVIAPFVSARRPDFANRIVCGLRTAINPQLVRFGDLSSPTSRRGADLIAPAQPRQRKRAQSQT